MSGILINCLEKFEKMYGNNNKISGQNCKLSAKILKMSGKFFKMSGKLKNVLNYFYISGNIIKCLEIIINVWKKL